MGHSVLYKTPCHPSPVPQSLCNPHTRQRLSIKDKTSKTQHPPSVSTQQGEGAGVEAHTWSDSDLHGVTHGRTANSTKMQVRKRDMEDSQACNHDSQSRYLGPRSLTRLQDTLWMPRLHFPESTSGRQHLRVRTPGFSR